MLGTGGGGAKTEKRMEGEDGEGGGGCKRGTHLRRHRGAPEPDGMADADVKSVGPTNQTPGPKLHRKR